jgi:hypothetical protein
MLILQRTIGALYFPNLPIHTIQVYRLPLPLAQHIYSEVINL